MTPRQRSLAWFAAAAVAVALVAVLDCWLYQTYGTPGTISGVILHYARWHPILPWALGAVMGFRFGRRKPEWHFMERWTILALALGVLLGHLFAPITITPSF